MSAADIDTEYLLQIRDGHGPRATRELAGKLVQVICELREKELEEDLSEKRDMSTGSDTPTLWSSEESRPGQHLGVRVHRTEHGSWIEVLKRQDAGMDCLVGDVLLDQEATKQLRALLAPPSGPKTSSNEDLAS